MATYFSSAAFGTQPLDETIGECARLGVGLEFTSNFSYSPDLIDRVRTIGTVPVLVHNYFPPPPEPFVLNLAATDERIRLASHALCRTAIRLTADVGAAFYSVHSGFAMNLQAEQLGKPEQQAALAGDCLIDYKAARSVFRESVFELSKYARGCGVGLLLENNVITPQQVAAGRADSLLMTSPAECRSFIDDLADPNVGLLLDTGHAVVSANALAFAAEAFFDLGPRIKALHLSDNDRTRDNNEAFSSEAWFAPRLRDFQERSIVVEVYGLNQEDRVRQRDVLFSLLQ